MKVFVTELIVYNFHTNSKMICTMMKNKEKLSKKTIDLMSHTLRAHEIWLNRLDENDTQLKVWETLEVDNFEKLNTDLFNRSNEIVKNKKLDLTVFYKNSKGEEFNNNILDVLFHIVNHSNYHRGQLNAEFKKLQIDPILTDYIFYKR